MTLKFKLIVGTTVLLFLLFGVKCAGMRDNFYYDYEEFVQPTKTGVIEFRLIGKFKTSRNKQERITTRESPYEMIIKYSAGSDTISRIALNNLTIQGTKYNFTFNIARNNELTKKAAYVKELKERYAGFLFPSLELKYQDYIVTGELLVFSNGLLEKVKIKAVLKTKFREFKSSDFWDRLMSV